MFRPIQPISEREDLKEKCNQLVDAMEANPGVGYSMANTKQYMVIILRKPPGA